MSFLLSMKLNPCFFFICNIENNTRLTLILSWVIYHMVVTKINKSESIQPQIPRIYEPNTFLPTDLIQLQQIFQIIVIRNDHHLKIPHTK